MFRFQELIKLRLVESGVGTEVAAHLPVAIVHHHRLQDRLSVFSAVHVARAQLAAFQIAKLVEAKQRVVTNAAEVAVVH